MLQVCLNDTLRICLLHYETSKSLSVSVHQLEDKFFRILNASDKAAMISTLELLAPTTQRSFDFIQKMLINIVFAHLSVFLCGSMIILAWFIGFSMIK